MPTAAADELPLEPIDTNIEGEEPKKDIVAPVDEHNETGEKFCHDCVKGIDLICFAVTDMQIRCASSCGLISINFYFEEFIVLTI